MIDEHQPYTKYTDWQELHIDDKTTSANMRGCSQLHIVVRKQARRHHHIMSIPDRRTSRDEDCDDRTEVELKVRRE